MVKAMVPTYNDKPKDPGLNHHLSLHLVSVRDFQDQMISTDYPMFVAIKKFGKKASLARPINADNQAGESTERDLNGSEKEGEMQ
jgi:hypothetical protein